MDAELKLNGFRQWDDVLPVNGAAPKDVTRIRYWLDAHGPFEATFDRNPAATVVQDAITDKRNHLRSLAAL